MNVGEWSCTLRVGLLLATLGAARCLKPASAGVNGDGRLCFATLADILPLFTSLGLGGSMASLLGTGVMLLEGRFLGSVADWVGWA